jgi:hypothetical protein
MIKDSTRHLMFRKGVDRNNPCKIAMRGPGDAYTVWWRSIADGISIAAFVRYPCCELTLQRDPAQPAGRMVVLKRVSRWLGEFPFHLCRGLIQRVEKNVFETG